MRRYGLYDATRGLATALSAGLAGVLLWLATLVGVQTVTRFWESMAIVAAAGLVVALSQVIGGWTKGHGVRVSPGTFLLAFVPVLICVGWILMATQPGTGWHEETVVRWSHQLGIFGLVHSLAGPLGADGIRINAVAPGDVPTPRNVREWGHVPGWYDGLRKSSPLGRLGTPEDIAAAYLALIDMRHVTGQVIVVDGGQTISRPAG